MHIMEKNHFGKLGLQHSYILTVLVVDSVHGRIQLGYLCCCIAIIFSYCTILFSEKEKYQMCFSPLWSFQLVCLSLVSSFWLYQYFKTILEAHVNCGKEMHRCEVV